MIMMCKFTKNVRKKRQKKNKFLKKHTFLKELCSLFNFFCNFATNYKYKSRNTSRKRKRNR